MILTKDIITRDEAMKLSPEFVLFCEGERDRWNFVWERFQRLKKGQKVLVYRDDLDQNEFLVAKVSNVDRKSIYAGLGDGLIVRVSNGEYSWRISSGEAFPI